MAEGGKYLNMKYWELLKEENEAVAERHELAMERIGHMKEEATVGEPYRAFFERTVQFIELIEETFQKQMDGTLAAMSQKEAAEFNRTLYADILQGRMGRALRTRTMRQKSWERTMVRGCHFSIRRSAARSFTPMRAVWWM